jgi:deoxyribodipyrimidine photo-lyase
LRESDKFVNTIPPLRVQVVRDVPVVTEAPFVLYWMVAHRRLTWNHALQRAVDWCRQLRRPLVIMEGLRCDYRWASDRLHWFAIQGMQDHARALADSPVTYFPYVEPQVGQGKGLLRELARHAAVVVTDDYPCLFVPHMIAAAGRQIGPRLESVDSNGILPLRLASKTFARAVDFRRFMHRNVVECLVDLPVAEPLLGLPKVRSVALPTEVVERWRPTPVLDLLPRDLVQWPIDHQVSPVATAGGSRAAALQLDKFLRDRLSAYEEQRRNVDQVGTSQLSPYLRFGHIAPTEVVSRVLQHEGWSPAQVNLNAAGSNRGFWGLPEAAESFLDELITWREVGFNMSHREPNYDRYTSLPAWAQRTLAQHATDPRPQTYSSAEFEAAQTHDPIWNAAQRQLVQDGVIHNYLRMLWGKKILHWSPSPEAALETLIHLNNKYAIDGRDPNSYSGIFWVLGRYDRAWGPERDVFGQIRYMTSDSTARKLSLKNYLLRYGPVRSAKR